MEYHSPGAAFSDTLDQLMQRRELQKHQALLDSLASKREDRLVQAELDAAKEHRDSLKSADEARKETAHKNAIADFEKRVKEMVPGDIPDAEMMAQAEKLGVAGQYFPTPKAAFAAPPTGAVPNALDPTAPAAPVVPDGAGGATMTGPPDAPAPPAQGMLRIAPPETRPFIGTSAQRKEITDRKAQEAYIAGLPDGPLKQAAEYELRTNKNVPAGAIKAPGSETEAVFRQNPRDTGSGSVQRLVDGQWVDWAGDVPKGSHFMSVPPPRDTSAHDLAAANAVQATKEHAYTEFNNRAKPLEDRIDRINKLNESLDQGTRIADSTLAEQLITITAGGSGSGVRITQPEIEQVLKNTRTKWEDLDMMLRRWSGDKTQSLVLNDDQRAAMRGLARAYRKAATKAHRRILDYRSQIDEADNVSSVNRIRTRAEEDLFSEPEPTATNDAPKKTAAEIIADIRNGKKP